MELEFDLECEAVMIGLERYALATGKAFSQVVKQEGRLICVNLAFQTKPFGDNDIGKQQGVLAIRRDLKRVYLTVGNIYDELLKLAGDGKKTGEQLAKAFYGAVQRGDLERARKILRSTGLKFGSVPLGKFDGGAAHRSRRGSRGRVNGRHPSLIVTDRKALRAYRTKIEKNVGIAKSGFVEPARALGGARGIPRWVTRHKGNGVIEDHSADLLYPHVRIINQVPWIKEALNDRQAAEAMRMQREKMQRHMQTVLHYEAARNGLKVA